LLLTPLAQKPLSLRLILPWLWFGIYHGSIGLHGVRVLAPRKSKRLADGESVALFVVGAFMQHHHFAARLHLMETAHSGIGIGLRFVRFFSVIVLVDVVKRHRQPGLLACQAFVGLVLVCPFLNRKPLSFGGRRGRALMFDCPFDPFV
jgi:hypothetical protein